MIIKFCFNNEIHRCTKPPIQFADLEPFLKKMFHSGLPAEFSLYYTDANNNKIVLSSQENYDNMAKTNPTGTIKIFIMQKEVEEKPSEDVDDSEIIEDKPKSEKDGEEFEVVETPKPDADEKKNNVQDNSDAKIESEKKVENHNDSFEDIDNIIASTAESKVYDTILSKNDIQQDQQVLLKELIHETLKEELPNVVSEVKEKLSRRSSVDISNSLPKPVEKKAVPAPVIAREEKACGFIQDAIQLAKDVKTSLSDFPDAMVDMIDTIQCLLEGDPKYFYAGDMYAKSVCAKTEQLRELFPDVPLRVLADFVNKLPKRLSFEEVVNVYLKSTISERLRVQQQQVAV